MKRAVMLLVVLLAACSSSSPPQKFTVRIVAEQAGLGCVGSAPISGTDSRVTVKDQSGKVIGTGTFVATPGTEACDWTADVTPSEHSDFLVLEGDKGKLATLTGADVKDGTVRLETNSLGDITVS